MNIRALVLLGILTGFLLHTSCPAEAFAHENLLVLTEQIDDQGHGDEQSSWSSFDLGDMNPDDFFAEIQAFEQENPQQDIPLEAKIKLAWEYLKIKVNDNKICIVGTVGLGTVVFAGFCLFYKYYVSDDLDSVE